MSEKNQIRTEDELEKCEYIGEEKAIHKFYRLFDEFVKIVFLDNKQIDFSGSEELKSLDAEFSELAKVDISCLEQTEIEEAATKEAPYKKFCADNDSGTNTSWLKRIEKLDGSIKTLLAHISFLRSLGNVESDCSKNPFLPEGKWNAAFLPVSGEGLWGGGEAVTSKNNDFPFVIKMLKVFFSNQNRPLCVEKVRNWIKEYCLDVSNSNGNPPMRNALLHFADPANHAPIFATGEKDKILKAFNSNVEGLTNTEMKLVEINKQLTKTIDDNNYKRATYFYHPCVSPIFNSKDDGCSDISALELKKSIILYGPPGTSKTYSAKQMGKTLLLKYMFNKSADLKVSPGFKNNCESHIRRLQLHPNYSYEDFIWGYEIKEGKQGSKSVLKKGYFLNLLDEINSNEDKEIPYVLILDEINRVDLSRLFGELFSAIENRNEKIDLPVKFNEKEGGQEDSICIPSNLYIIGTMNEIDFSLERVDFALRRRFVWRFKGYDKEVLFSMLKDNVSNHLKEWSEYVKSCNDLNSEIAENPNLGKQYEIGHTIFADIYKIFDMIGLKISVKNLEKAKKVLWSISIKPLLEAYFGNLSQDEKQSAISELAKKFGVETEKVGES